MNRPKNTALFAVLVGVSALTLILAVTRLVAVSQGDGPGAAAFEPPVSQPSPSEPSGVSSEDTPSVDEQTAPHS